MRSQSAAALLRSGTGGLAREQRILDIALLGFGAWPKLPLRCDDETDDAVKALVLAGGSGTRLRPITYTSAKQLVPVANKPVLFYGLEAIANAGITEVGLVVGDTAAAIEEAVGDGSAFGLRAVYIRQEAPLGLAHAVLVARAFLGDDDFVMYLGDNFIVGGITELTDEFQTRRPHAQIMLTRVPDPREFGVAELDVSGQVVGLEEKPCQPKSDLALVGVYLFTPAIHEAVRHLRPSWRGELEITEAIQWLIDHGQTVRSTIITGYWKDTGNVTDMLEVNRLVLEGIEPRHHGAVGPGCEIIGRVAIEAGTHVSGSRIVGPAIIGAGTKITGSYIGPFTAIGQDCVIADSEIEYSIVLHGASILGVRRIGASLIGRHAEITPAPRVPRVHRLVLGDHSKVQIGA
jgi:glucose-1-phosphate thymidylyltransferase